MPRIAEGRPPAEPTSPDQRDRYQRILRAAISQGSKLPLERVQMTEVAKEAGVAIATLYRYFPSKTQLFSSVMQRQIGQLDRVVAPRGLAVPPDVAVADLLVAAGTALLQWPHLASSMLQANLVSISANTDMSVTLAFRDMLLKVAGIEGEASSLDQRLIRVIEQAWYGILISALNGFITAEEAEADTRLSCERLLGDLGSSVPETDRTLNGLVADA